jgi:uncharacterized protein YkwD
MMKLDMPTQRPRLLSLVLLATLALACKRDTTSTPLPPDTEPGDPQPGDPADDRSDPNTSTEPGGRDTPVHDPVAQAFLDAHNHHRAERSATLAQPLPQLAWSSALAEHAMQVANACNFEHSSSDFGENLSARTDAAAPRDVVDAWVAEREHYDERKHACARGQVCGHYTQVMWRATTQVGCATRRCTQGSPFGGGEWSLSVCNYAPAGNMQGQAAF